MAFNADDIWEFPAAAVVAASTIQHRVKQIRERSCKQPSSSVRSEPLGVLLQPPGIAVAAAAHATGLPIPPGAAQVPRPGQASLPTFSDCSADKWFLFRRAYTVCCQINNWDDLRSRRQLLLALKDNALAKIANLQPTPDPLPVGWNLEAFLDQIVGKFVHQVDTFRARAEYRSN
jgi:hypothetical protein